MVDILIRNGADVNLLDNQDRTPLQMNAKFGNSDFEMI